MRPIARALLVSVLLIIVAFVAFAYWSGTASWRYPTAGQARPVGTTGTVDVDKARERGAEVGEKIGVAASKVERTVDEAAITSKIKAKMMLDDSVKARTIDVTTHGTTVTLSGTVRSNAEHDRALALARETAGVSQVVDRLQIQP
jgi:osmotically-inducible protein OsmY